jgi:hypothetical protein
MPDPVRICLSSSGVVSDLPILPESAAPWKSGDLGEFVTIEYSFLDDCADRLSVPTVSSFVYSSWAGEPQWHEAAEGLRTFEALATELIGRIGHDDSIERMEDLLWDVRMLELILRQAERKGEKFYLQA